MVLPEHELIRGGKDMKEGKKYNFLVVDDEFPIVKIISDILALHPNTGAVYSAGDGERALEVIQHHKIDILITDILMPRLSGIELIKILKEKNRDIHIIAISASTKIDLVREAVRNGAYDYILKPFSVDEIMFSVNRVVDRLKLLQERSEYIADLEVRIKEADVVIQDSVFDSFLAILNTLEARNKAVFEHSQKVALLSEKTARAMGKSADFIANCQIGGMFHDIGKIGLPDRILLSRDRLSAADVEIIKTHPGIGKKILLPIFRSQKDIISFICHHHEGFDGGGYPDGLKGEAIPQIARIACVVNAYAAMTAVSLFKDKKDHDEAVAEIRAQSGKQFDPEIAALFVEKVVS
jgi:putative two-component system response regulator